MLSNWKLVELIPPVSIFSGSYIFSIASSYLLLGDVNIIVDPGAQIVSLTLLRKLEELNVNRRDIDYVLLTHMHGDHYFNTVFFHDAEIIVHKRSVDAWKSSMVNRYGESKSKLMYELIFGERNVRFLSGEKVELFKGLEIISTNIHQPGHLIVLVRTDKGCEALTGDAISLTVWDLIAILQGEMELKNREYRKILNYLLDKCDIVHQSHYPPLYVKKIKEKFGLK